MQNIMPKPTGLEAHPTAMSTLAAADTAGRRWDVVVVGAGPAGSLAAREIARQGVAVLLVDKAMFPRRKVCGCCLNGAALAALERAGLADLPHRLGAQPLGRWQLSSRVGRVECELPAGVALSRAALDAELVRVAVAAGAHFLDGARATIVADRDELRSLIVRRDQQQYVIRAEVIVAADGLAGGVIDDLPDFRRKVSAHGRIGAGAVIDDGPDRFAAGTIYMACGRAGYVGLVRLEDGALDIAAALFPAAIRDAHGLPDVVSSILQEANFPVPHELDQATWRGTPALTRHCYPVAARRILLVGDAAGYVEPFTGEGMAWAVNSALAAAPLAVEAASGWKPALAQQWIRRHRRLIGRRQLACRAVAQIMKTPRRTDLAVRVLRVAPWLARPIIRSLNWSAHFADKRL